MMKQGRRTMMLDKSAQEAQEAVNSYMSAVAELKVNSKPHINALTFLAEDYLNYAEAIVKAVDDHLLKVPSNEKLPILYLIDSIIKNVQKDYINLFSRTMVQSFSTVFRQVDEKTRQQMYKLRLTWKDIYSQEDLYAMDLSVNKLDPNWPITAAPPQPSLLAHKIHINPKFLKPSSAAVPTADVVPEVAGAGGASPEEALALPAVAKTETDKAARLREQLLQRKKELLQLQKEKVDLELSQIKKQEKDKEKKVVTQFKEKVIPQVPVSVPSKEKPVAVPATPIKEEHLVMIKEEGKKAVKLEAPKKEAAFPLPDLALAAPSSHPKIAPVSMGLVNLVTSTRAQRDPRLSKLKEEPAIIEIPKDEVIKAQVRSKDPRLSSKRSRSSDKDSSKSSRGHSRDTSADRSSSSRHSSRREDKEKRSSESRKSSRKSDDRSSSRSKTASSRSPAKSSSKRDRRDSNRSPRKSSYSSHRPVSDAGADSADSDASDVVERVVSPISPRPGSTSIAGSSTWPVNYTKGSHKGRNYRTDKGLQEEPPEVVSSTVSSDTDLRAPPEKQIRLASSSERLLQSSSSTLSPGVPEQTLPTIACHDVDLRGLLSSPGKKRRSAEPEDGQPPNKKNKAARIESLFGKQDVDLRQKDLNNGLAVEAPSPPPPPIISSPEGQTPRKEDSLGWSKFKQTLTPSPTVERSPAFPRSSRHDRLGRSSGESELSQNEDTDMRLHMNGLESSSKPDCHAILARAHEQFKNGTMSQADFKQVQKQVFRIHESEKIREAQRNDYTRRDSWERRPREKDYRHGLASPDQEHGDIDERYPGPASRPSKKPLLPLPSQPPMAPVHSRHMGQRMPMVGAMYRPHRGMGMSGPRSGPRGYYGGSWRYPRGGASGYKDGSSSLPPADNFILDRIAQDPMRTITIDSIAREIRFYGEDAVAFLSADNPCEISFDPGEATIIVNEVAVHCAFHQAAKEINISGKIYRVRLGAPTRELYINDEGFECQFNCPPKEVYLGTGEILSVQLQSEEWPKVHVGNTRRDLVAGRVSLIIDAEVAVPIFLDAKPQRFDIDCVPHIIKFADALETVLINSHPFNIQFGGSAVPVIVNGKKHYIRLTELPPDVVPGEVEIVSMSGRVKKPTSSMRANSQWDSSQDNDVRNPAEVETDHEPALPMHEPVLPVRGGLGVLSRGMPKRIPKPRGPRPTREPTDSLKPARIEDRQMPADLLQAIQPGLPSLLGLLPNSSGYSCTTSTVSGAYPLRQGTGSGVAPSVAPNGTDDATANASSAGADSTNASNGIPFLGQDLDISKLFQSLYDTGIMSSINSLIDTKKEKVKEEEDDAKKKIHEVNFKEASTSFKVKQPALIDILYSGIQCSSCGTRFPPEQTEKYSAHLDWHFRQNRRDKDSARKPQSRKWYYDVSDWIQFEEIDDTVDKAQNWFDTQQSEASKFEEAEEEEIQSVPSKDFAEGAICDLCHDRFDQYYNEEKEEWHLKDCLVADGVPYHPFCYKDFRVSLESNEEEPQEPAEAMETTEAPESTDAPESTEATEADPAEAASEAAGASTEDEPMPAVEIKKEPEDTVVKKEETVVKEEEGPQEKEKEKEVETEASAEAVVKEEKEIKQEETEGEKRETEEDPAPVAESVDPVDPVEEKEAEEQVPLSEQEQEELADTPVVKTEAVDGPDDNATENDPDENKEEGEEVKKEPGVEEDADNTEKSTDAAPGEEETSEPKDLEEPPPPPVNTNVGVVSCSIDGNLDLAQAPAALPSVPNRIKINITKPIFVKPAEETEDESDHVSESEDQEGQAGLSEPSSDEVLVLKPRLLGRRLKELPPKVRGNEISGLCSIM